MLPWARNRAPPCGASAPSSDCSSHGNGAGNIDSRPVHSSGNASQATRGALRGQNDNSSSAAQAIAEATAIASRQPGNTCNSSSAADPSAGARGAPIIATLYAEPRTNSEARQVPATHGCQRHRASNALPSTTGKTIRTSRAMARGEQPTSSQASASNAQATTGPTLAASARHQGAGNRLSPIRRDNRAEP